MISLLLTSSSCIDDQSQRRLSDLQTHNCLKDLGKTDPRVDKTRIEGTKGGLLEDSYRWILDNAEFRQWRDDKQSRLLWIRGDPGKGKTMLLCGIINELEKSTANLLSFFFCQATDSRINNATAVLRSLIYLLVKKHPPLISHILDSYDAEGKYFEGENAWWALSNIFDGIIQDPRLQDTYLIVDALDECVKDLPWLLAFIVKRSSASPRVKWIVSSRDWPLIKELLDTAIEKVTLRLELNDKSISAAVGTYIKYKLEHLAKMKTFDPKTRDAVMSHLSLNAKGTFLWVALVCQELEKVHRWQVLAKLDAFPPGLNSLYRRMIEQICDLDEAHDEAYLCKRILAVLSIVYRPITLQELTTLIDIPDTISEHSYLEHVIGLCGSFLTLRDSTIYFIHQSAKDFLLEKAADKIFPFGIKIEHYSVVSRSIQVMSDTLRRNIYGLPFPGFPIDQVERPKPDPLAAVRYSSMYWIDHLCDCNQSQSSSWYTLWRMQEYEFQYFEPLDWNGHIFSSLGKWCYLAISRFWIYLCLWINFIWSDLHSNMNVNSDLQDGGSIEKFLRQSYLYWLEALSLLKGMDKGVVSITKLEGLLQVSVNLIAQPRRFRSVLSSI